MPFEMWGELLGFPEDFATASALPHSEGITRPCQLRASGAVARTLGKHGSMNPAGKTPGLRGVLHAMGGHLQY
jgi:hypothetical protein